MSSGCGPSSAISTGCRRSGVAATCGAREVPTDLWEIAGWALACSVPVVLAGAIIIRLARSWSLAVSMVALALIPVLATFSGVLGASGFMLTDTFEKTAVVLVI